MISLCVETLYGGPKPMMGMVKRKSRLQCENDVAGISGSWVRIPPSALSILFNN